LHIARVAFLAEDFLKILFGMWMESHFMLIERATWVEKMKQKEAHLQPTKSHRIK
jgi:hypothetical protein